MNRKRSVTIITLLILAVFSGTMAITPCAPAYAQEIGFEKTWGGEDSESAGDVALDQDGNIYVIGTTSSFGAGDNDAFVLKYAPDGALIWEKTWGGEAWDEGYGVAVDKDGNIIVVGVTGSFGVGSSNLFVLKYGPDGTLIWQKTWGEYDLELSLGLAVDQDENIVVVGETWSFGAGARAHSVEGGPRLGYSRLSGSLGQLRGGRRGR